MDIGDVLVGGLLGGIITIAVWWLTQRRGLALAHRHHIVEEHTKNVQSYTEKYYWKIATSVGNLSGQLGRIQKKLKNGGQPDEQDFQLCFYSVARLSKLFEAWFQDTTVLLVTDRTGEAVVGALLDTVDGRFSGSKGWLSAIEDAKIRREISPYEPLPDFLRKLKCEPLRSIDLKFRSALQTHQSELEGMLTEIDCLQKLFVFELDAFYDAWYGKKGPRPRFGNDERGIIVRTLGDFVESREISARERDKYLVKLGLRDPCWRYALRCLVRLLLEGTWPDHERPSYR